jgi:hypothetical protein
MVWFSFIKNWFSFKWFGSVQFTSLVWFGFWVFMPIPNENRGVSVFAILYNRFLSSERGKMGKSGGEKECWECEK